MSYLLSIEAVRPRCKVVFEKALANQLTNFDVDLSKLDNVIDLVVKTIQDDFGTEYDTIPPHGRWQHFEAGGVKRVDQLVDLLRAEKEQDSKDITGRLVDLFLVSVLLDAGAGKHWKYIEPGTGQIINRSEGLAVACYHMFKNGVFSSDASDPFRVDSKALVALDEESFRRGMQVDDSNPLEGFKGRLALLNRLGKALGDNEDLFGRQGRPGGLVEYLLTHDTTKDGTTIQLTTLWNALMEGLGPIWPQEGRTKLNGIVLGDTWPCSSMTSDEKYGNLVPFHKLTQWLCYSLLTPIKKYLQVQFIGESLQTGLPEYRNGGLLVDVGVLTLKKSALATSTTTTSIPTFPVESDVIVEWRATTVGFLDLILDKVNERLSTQLTLPQLLEAGTWKAGRRVAAQLRPETSGPPIDIISDGTVF